MGVVSALSKKVFSSEFKVFSSEFSGFSFALSFSAARAFAAATTATPEESDTQKLETAEH
jgi:hypothetical protein